MIISDQNALEEDESIINKSDNQFHPDDESEGSSLSLM